MTAASEAARRRLLHHAQKGSEAAEELDPDLDGTHAAMSRSRDRCNSELEVIPSDGWLEHVLRWTFAGPQGGKGAP